MREEIKKYEKVKYEVETPNGKVEVTESYVITSEGERIPIYIGTKRKI